MTFLMTYAADILVILASLGAMTYCLVLSRRLNRLTSFDKGLGGAIAVMSSQVDEMKAALRDAKAGSDGAGKQLTDLVQQARDISTELELMIAACHDFAEEAIVTQGQKPAGQPDAETVTEGSEEQSGRAETEDFVDPDVTPIFGSRRSPPANEGSHEKPAAALFRHRKTLAG